MANVSRVATVDTKTTVSWHATVATIPRIATVAIAVVSRDGVSRIAVSAASVSSRACLLVSCQVELKSSDETWNKVKEILKIRTKHKRMKGVAIVKIVNGIIRI